MAARKPHKHRRGKGRLGKVIQLLFVLALLGAMTVGATVFFQVEQVVVTGNNRYTQEEIVAATGIQTGDNLFRMNKFAIQDHVLEEMPYLEDILIRRKLPSTITVAVQEWDAVAQILPNAGWVAPEPEETKEGEEIVLPVATDVSWLISVGGKLLEQAPAEDTRMKITGLTALDAREGLQMTVPEEEQTRLDAVLSLLEHLEAREMLSDVSVMEVGATNLVLEYLGRYDVKLPLNGDFDYKLESLQAAVADQESKKGQEITGTFDLTQKNYTVVYSPARIK